MSASLSRWLNEKPFTLALSSSFFGFFAHCGFAAALYEAGHRPAKITGSSAGALVAAALASGLEPAQVREILFEVKREDFWDPFIGFGFLRGKKFERHLEARFAREFSQTKIPLAVSVFDLWSWKTRYLNEGSVAKAVVASCSVPLMFHPVRMGGRIFLDGGIFNKSGIHPGDPRVLCVYLESAGAAGAYERRTTFPKLDEDHKVLRFTNFPRVSFNSLARGPDAYQNIYERTKAALASSVADNIAGNFLDA